MMKNNTLKYSLLQKYFVKKGANPKNIRNIAF